MATTHSPSAGLDRLPPTAPLQPAAGVRFAVDLASHGHRVALVAPDGTSISYLELAERVHEVARSLGPQRRLVMVEGANEVDPIVTYLAALAGGHPVLLAPGSNPGALRVLASRFDPDWQLTPSSGVATLTERRDPGDRALHPDLALVLSTSGTTGTSKAVRLSRANLESNADAIATYLGIADDDRAITSLPMHYCYGLSVLHSHLARGAAVVLSSESVVDSCFWSRFHESGATSFAGVPHTFDLLDRVGFDAMVLPTLRYVTQAGGRLAPEKVRRLSQLSERRGWNFFVMYGQTEATARMAYLPPERAGDAPGAIGRPIPGGELRIEPLKGEAHGELVYRGPNVMLGYADGPADLALGRTISELRTGDLARKRPDGLYEIVGRATRFIKPFGVRVDLDSVERLLHAEGVEAMCTGSDERLVVAVCGDGDADVARAMVQDRLGLPRPSVVVCPFAELPRLANGKPDYVTIRDHGDRAAALAFAEATHDSSAETPGSGLSERGTVRRIFADVLGIDDIRDGDTFVTLGGDSLSYVQASMRIEKALGQVPADWQVTAVGELERLGASTARRRGSWRWMETNVVIRALAIFLVVGTHSTLFRQQGGAHLLFAAAGFNFARFQLGGGHRQLERPDRGVDTAVRRTVVSMARIAVPTVALTALAMVLREGFAPSNLLLVHNFAADGRWWYWYIEALLQVLAALAVIFSVPAVRRLERAHPFAFPSALLVPLVALRFEVVDLGRLLGVGEPVNPKVVPHVIAWLFVLGWLAQRSTGVARRLLVTLLVLAVVPGFFDDPSRELVIGGGLLLILWVRSLPVPSLLQPVLGTVASASMYVYLTHFFVFAEVRDSRGPATAVAVSLALGIVTWWVVEPGRRRTLEALRHRRARRGDTGRQWRTAVPAPVDSMGSGRST